MKHPKDDRYDARPARSKLIPCGLEGGCVALCVGELEDMASPPGLLAVAREKMRTRHLALRTEHAYLQWLRRYLVFHGRRHPRDLGAPEVEQFLTHLAVHRKVSAATQNQALQALLFLYRHVLQIELPWLDNLTRASHPRRRPVVLSRAEVRSLLSQLQGAPWLVANLLYGSGLRLMEALRLRVKDLALERGELIVREAKGGKDRVTVLPAVLDAPLRGHLTRLRAWYEEERRRARPGVSVPFALARKYPQAATQWGWLPRSVLRSTGTPPSAREEYPACGAGCSAQGRHQPAGQQSHPASLLRHPFARGRLRRSYGAGAARPR